jgi:hypothetical protein
MNLDDCMLLISVRVTEVCVLYLPKKKLEPKLKFQDIILFPEQCIVSKRHILYGWRLSQYFELQTNAHIVKHWRNRALQLHAVQILRYETTYNSAVNLSCASGFDFVFLIEHNMIVTLVAMYITMTPRHYRGKYFFFWNPFYLQAVQIHLANVVKLLRLQTWRGVLNSNRLTK